MILVSQKSNQMNVVMCWKGWCHAVALSKLSLMDGVLVGLGSHAQLLLGVKVLAQYYRGVQLQTLSDYCAVKLYLDPDGHTTGAGHQLQTFLVRS